MGEVWGEDGGEVGGEVGGVDGGEDDGDGENGDWTITIADKRHECKVVLFYS